MSVVDATGGTALESAFTKLRLGAPESSVVRVPSAPGATHDVSQAPDLAAQMDRFGILRLPDRLAGFNVSDPVVGGTATYGKGLVRFVALPVNRRRSDPDQLVNAARASGAVSRLLPGGEVLVISSGAVHLVVARADTTRTYVITGLVQPDILVRAAAELFATPPHFRGDPFA